jgi:UDP-GlcNAc:undecaprenyl-phosphate GlcNAc-1-phosphate transferase
MSEATRYLLAFVLSFAGAWVLTPVCANLARRTGVVSKPRDDRSGDRSTPFLGGLAIGVGLLVAAIVSTPEREAFLGIGIGVLVIGLLGLADDVRGLGPWLRLTVEGVAGVTLWLGGIRAGFFDLPALDLALTVLWVATLTNAVNILDNMDGVAAGVVAVAAGGLAVMAASQGDYLVASFGIAIMGGCLGFLRYNFPPAKVYMGDAGSLMLGFLLAVVSLKLDAATPYAVIRAAVAMLAVGVPLFDLTLVVISRWRQHRPIFRGGLDHTAHRLTAGGLSARHVAFAAYASQAAASVGAIVTYRASLSHGIVAAAFGVTLAAILLVVFLRMETLPYLAVQAPTPAPETESRGAIG